MSANLVREYTHPDKLLSDTQGNVQVLPNGNVLVGWGSAPVFSEFDHRWQAALQRRLPDRERVLQSLPLPVEWAT